MMSENPFAATTIEEAPTGPLGRETRTLRYIHPLRAAVVSAVVSGLVPGLFALVFGVIMIGVGAGNGDLGAAGVGVGMMLAAPVIYGAMGFVGGLVGACIYNVAASMGIGLRVDFE